MQLEQYKITISTVLVFPLILFISLFLLASKVEASEPIKAEMYMGDYEIRREKTPTGSIVNKEVKYIETGSGKIIKERTSETNTWKISYYHTNHQGSTSVVSNNQGKVDTEYSRGRLRYFPYGEQITSHNINTQVVVDTYTGQKKDTESDLMFYNARLYNQNTGLFMQADSVNDGLNRYAYVGGNPVNMIDPSGNISIEDDNRLGPEDRAELLAERRRSEEAKKRRKPELIFAPGGTQSRTFNYLNDPSVKTRDVTNIDVWPDMQETIYEGLNGIPPHLLDGITYRLYPDIDVTGTDAPPASAYPEDRSIDIYGFFNYFHGDMDANKGVATHEAYHIFLDFRTDYLGDAPIQRDGDAPLYQSGIGLTINETVQAILYLNDRITGIQAETGQFSYSGCKNPGAHECSNPWEYGAEATRKIFYPEDVTLDFSPDPDVIEFLKYIYNNPTATYK